MLTFDHFSKQYSTTMDNADLSKLRLTPGKLSPKFKASVTDYSVVVPSTTPEVKISPLTSDSGASYTIKGADDSKVAKLIEGQTHTVEVTVTAEDGKSTKTYIILIRRLSADDASLSQLELSAGVLKPTFSPLGTKYECYLPSSIESLSVRAKTEDEAMKLSMKDGSPVGTVPLNPGHTLIELSVQSVSGKSSTIYTITVIKNRLPVTLQLKSGAVGYECAVCCGVVACPTRIKNGPYIYCQTCLEELTRTNKSDPFTGERFGEQQWMLEDLELDSKLSKELAICPLAGGEVEAPMQQIGAKLLAERLKRAQAEEPTQACPDCSKKVPTETMPLHKEKLCTAKHSISVPKQEVKTMAWEQSLAVASGDVKGLLKKAEECENEYLQSLPKPGKTQHYSERRSPLDYLQTAAACYASAIKSSPKDSKAHLGLGLIMEEFFYAEDLYGLQREDTSSSEEGEAERSSKEEEFLAICKLHGVPASAPVAIQLKAVEAEYHSLKDAGQAHKAEHVQGLHAWKSKKVLEESQGAYSVDTESPLYRAKIKFQDAVSTATSDGLLCYHLGRLCLLLGETESANTHLLAALSLKPTLSEARFCLGLALPTAANSHSKVLLLHGLTEYLRQTQEVNESQANPKRMELRRLNSRTLYRSSNPLMVDGFLQLSKLGGHGHLSSTHCQLAASSAVATACLQHRANTYQKLLWGSLKARSALLNSLHKQKHQSVLRQCKQLSALIACSSLPSSPQVRELQMEVFQLGVVLQPSSSEALCHLGNGQLTQYEATSEQSWLRDAELSFRASIAMERKAISPTIIPEHLKNQEWWKKRQAKSEDPSKGGGDQKKLVTATTKQPATGKQATSTSQTKTTGVSSARAPPGRAPARTVGGQARKPAVGRGAAQTKTATKPGGTKPGGVAKSSSGVTKPAQVSVAKTGSQKTVTKPAPPPQDAVPPPAVEPAPPPTSTQPGGKTEVNKRSHHPRMGLARALAKHTDTKKQEEAHGLYRDVIAMAPEVHDAYIEVGEMLAKSSPMEAVDVYCKYPFNDPPTFDDAFLHGEIVRLLMSSEAYNDPRLCSSMVAMGRALGIGVLEKQVSILENKFKSALLKKVYAGVHGKPVDDPDLQAFFKFKCWL